MKIKLLVDVAVDRKHGMTKGRVFDLVDNPESGNWVMGDVGELVKVFPRECKEVADGDGEES